MRPGDSSGGGETLVQAILARTTGGACGRAREQACTFVDDDLSSLDRNLMEGHLAHCAACAALVVELARLRIDLPGLAEVRLDGSLDEALTQGVLRATTQRPSRPAPAGWWRRPRLALEAAYLASAAGFVLVNLPVPGPVQGLVRQAGRDAQAAPQWVDARRRSMAQGLQAGSREVRQSVCQQTGAFRRGWDRFRMWLVAVPERVSSWFHRVFFNRTEGAREPSQTSARSAS